MTRTALYRVFAADHCLMYVGVARSPFCRLSDHERLSDWCSQSSTISLEWFDDRASAYAAEARAIQSENPRHNDIHKAKTERLNPDLPAVRGVSQTTAAEWSRLADEGLSPAQAAARVGKTPAAARKAAQIYGIKFQRGKRAETTPSGATP